MEIRLPSQSLVILCGPSGSGKSTFAKRFFEETQIVSSDSCRRLASDTEEFAPESTAPAFRLLHALIEERLRLGRLTVVDSTALLHWMRASFIDLAQRVGVPVCLLVFRVDLEECVRRDRARPRTVGRWIVERQFRELETGLLQIPFEPFDRVYQVTPEDAPTVRLVLEPGADIPGDPPAPPQPTRGDLPLMIFDEARRLLDGSRPSSAAMAEARRRLQAGGDAGWQVGLPLAFEDFPAPKRGATARAVWSAAKAHLRDAGVQRVLLRAAPPGIDGVAVFARDAESAAEAFGEDAGRRSMLLLPEWTQGPAPEFSDRLEHARQDLLNTGFFRRHGRGVVALDVRLGGGVLHATGIHLPQPEARPDSPLFFWDFAEAEALTAQLEPCARRVVDLAGIGARGHADWFTAQAAEGREVWAAACIDAEGEAITRGADEPPLRLWPPAKEPAGAPAAPLHPLRRLAQRAAHAGDFDTARMIVETAWAVRPGWRPAPPDLFQGAAGAGPGAKA